MTTIEGSVFELVTTLPSLATAERLRDIRTNLFIRAMGGSHSSSDAPPGFATASALLAAVDVVGTETVGQEPPADVVPVLHPDSPPVEQGGQPAVDNFSGLCINNLWYTNYIVLIALALSTPFA